MQAAGFTTPGERMAQMGNGTETLGGISARPRGDGRERRRPPGQTLAAHVLEKWGGWEAGR